MSLPLTRLCGPLIGGGIFGSRKDYTREFWSAQILQLQFPHICYEAVIQGSLEGTQFGADGGDYESFESFAEFGQNVQCALEARTLLSSWEDHREHLLRSSYSGRQHVHDAAVNRLPFNLKSLIVTTLINLEFSKHHTGATILG